MQQIAYDQSPYITLTYPEWLEAYDDAQWTGWVRTPSGDGPVIYTQYNIDSYLFAEPKPATAETANEGGGSTGVIVAAVVVAVAVVGHRDARGRAPAASRRRGVRVT